MSSASSPLLDALNRSKETLATYEFKEACNALSAKVISRLRALKRPPANVVDVVRCVNILAGKKRTWIDPNDYDEMKLVLGWSTITAIRYPGVTRRMQSDLRQEAAMLCAPGDYTSCEEARILLRWVQALSMYAAVMNTKGWRD